MEKLLRGLASGIASADIGLAKLVTALITYFDLDAKGYRTAKGSWKVRF